MQIQRRGKIIKITEAQREERDAQYSEHVLNTADQLLRDVPYDLLHQFSKFGSQRLDTVNWLAVLFEESGEYAAAVNQQDWAQAKKEIKQTIACLIRLYVEIEREEEGIADEERLFYSRVE